MSDHESFTPPSAAGPSLQPRTLDAGAPAWTPPYPVHHPQQFQPQVDPYGHFDYLRHEYAKMGAQYAYLMAEQERLQEWENDLRRREGLLNMAHTRGSGRSVRGRWHGGRGRGGGRGTHGHGHGTSSGPAAVHQTPTNSYSSILKAAPKAAATASKRPTRPPQCASKSDSKNEA